MRGGRSAAIADDANPARARPVSRFEYLFMSNRSLCFGCRDQSRRLQARAMTSRGNSTQNESEQWNRSICIFVAAQLVFGSGNIMRVLACVLIAAMSLAAQQAFAQADRAAAAFWKTV